MTKIHYIFLIVLVLVGTLYLSYKKINSSMTIKKPNANTKDTQNITETTTEDDAMPSDTSPSNGELVKTPEAFPSKIISNGIKFLYPTATNGREWFSTWTDGNLRSLKSGQRDPYNNEFVSRGNGTTIIDGNGIATISGDTPRMYVYDQAKSKRWKNVEITVYAKRVAETGTKSSQGIVIGARSEHQDVTSDTPCMGQTYYGRVLYDGRASFQKELIHDKAYSDNKPSENNKAVWNTNNGTMPLNTWIGVKYIIYNSPDNKSVNMELYRDLTNGENGGTWVKLAEYTDNGNWSKPDAEESVKDKCGHGSNKVFTNPATSIFIRNDLVAKAEYKLFSIREINPY